MDVSKDLLVSRILLNWLLVAIVITILSSGCISKSPQTVKIGVVAPFEGRYREIGYEVIPAIRLAVREWAEQNPERNIAIEVIAYDDRGNPELAAEQAQKLLLDPDVAVVIGHWLTETTSAALPMYSRSEIPVVTYSEIALEYDYRLYNLAPAQDDLKRAANTWSMTHGATLIEDWNSNLELNVLALDQKTASSANENIVLLGNISWGLGQFYALAEGNADGAYFISGNAMPSSSDLDTAQAQQFANSFKAGSAGAEPGLFSLTAYYAAKVAIDVILLEQTGESFVALTEENISFDDDGKRLHAPIYLYQWEGGKRLLIEELN